MDMDPGTSAPLDEAPLERYRARLFGIAFRMLGDVQDAEDLVQEAMLRWHQAERATVREPEGWLVAVVTRLAIDRLRQAQTRRAVYPGPWLPELALKYGEHFTYRIVRLNGEPAVLEYVAGHL